jgi:iron complex transport system substrate-binding protein
MSRRTPRTIVALAAAAALALGACATDTGERAGDTGGGDSTAAFPVTVGTLTLDKRPERIVVLGPTATEMLYAIGAGSQVVAVDDNSNHPPEAPRTDLSAFTPNAEAIAARQPDLVVLTDDRNKIVDQLGQLRIPHYQVPAAQTLDDTYRQLTDLGTLTGHRDEAADLVRRMRDDIAKLTADLPQRSRRLTYFYELGPEYYTATSKTFIGSLFSLVGLENIADPADADGAKGGYPQLSEEAIIQANPDLIFLADTRCCQQSPETVRARTGWSGITAVRNNQIVVLDDDIASRWGPRVVDLLRAIVDAVARIPA